MSSWHTGVSPWHRGHPWDRGVTPWHRGVSPCHRGVSPWDSGCAALGTQWWQVCPIVGQAGKGKAGRASQALSVRLVAERNQEFLHELHSLVPLDTGTQIPLWSCRSTSSALPLEFVSKLPRGVSTGECHTREAAVGQLLLAACSALRSGTTPGP